MKFLRKQKILLMHIAVIALLLGLAVVFCEEIQAAKLAVYYKLFPASASEVSALSQETILPDDQVVLHPVEHTGTEWYLDHPLIYHAGGQIESSTYTNSLEAVEKTLLDNPEKCVVEIDLQRTSDGVLVCAHDWTDVLVSQTDPMTEEEFLAQKIQGRYTPMTAADLLRIMQENPQMYVVTDTKLKEPLTSVIGDLVTLSEGDPDILSRLIIQLYTGRESPRFRRSIPLRMNSLSSRFMVGAHGVCMWPRSVTRKTSAS